MALLIKDCKFAVIFSQYKDSIRISNSDLFPVKTLRKVVYIHLSSIYSVIENYFIKERNRRRG